MGRNSVVFRAAIVRIALGVFTLAILPVMYPGLAPHRPIFAAYVASTLIEQLLIWRDIGGDLRSFVYGLVDLALVTFIVHRVGSASTMMVSLYLMAGTLNALAVSFRVGLALGIVAACAYAGLLGAEQLGWLPYGPAAPPWTAGARPGPVTAWTVGAMVALLIVGSTAVVGMLVRAVRRNEHALMEANVRLEELSQRDPLTQLYNRRHLMARLEAELARLRRGHPLAAVMIDLDGFKRVNDSAGHLRGDQLLQDLAAALQGATRETDVAGRYGGDEFVVILPDTTAEQARAAAQRLTTAIEEVGLCFDRERPVTASVGVAVAVETDDARGLLKRADVSAYSAKQSGGNRVVVSV